MITKTISIFLVTMLLLHVHADNRNMGSLADLIKDRTDGTASNEAPKILMQTLTAESFLKDGKFNVEWAIKKIRHNLCKHFSIIEDTIALANSFKDDFWKDASKAFDSGLDFLTSTIEDATNGYIDLDELKIDSDKIAEFLEELHNNHFDDVIELLEKHYKKLNCSDFEKDDKTQLWFGGFVFKIIESVAAGYVGDKIRDAFD